MPGLRLVFLGPPGSGKGTQAQKLARRFGLVPLSSGDVLRKEIRAGSTIGREAAEFVESGKLVPDEVISGVMLSGIAKLPAGTGFVLDGFPRTVAQAEALERGLATDDRRLDVAIDFQVPDDLIVSRIVNRRVCNKCGSSYNTLFLPPKAAGICDVCGEALTQRVDDREDVIVTRLATYRAQTAPLVDYYRKRGLLQAVDAGASSFAVEAQVLRIVEARDRSA